MGCGAPASLPGIGSSSLRTWKLYFLAFELGSICLKYLKICQSAYLYVPGEGWKISTCVRAAILIYLCISSTLFNKWLLVEYFPPFFSSSPSPAQIIFGPLPLSLSIISLPSWSLPCPLGWRSWDTGMGWRITFTFRAIVYVSFYMV